MRHSNGREWVPGANVTTSEFRISRPYNRHRTPEEYTPSRVAARGPSTTAKNSPRAGEVQGDGIRRHDAVPRAALGWLGVSREHHAHQRGHRCKAGSQQHENEMADNGIRSLLG